ncbi:hypothetical protein M2302_000308 [Micromonospora sp. A200]|uniref:hypothetical protein n=1 Tax=Micromonospora sp. A200 TaxID=2940568 RepID=UPI0024766C84|nr:hypothetical protein [Micromonospora sp. A200]MDH6460157.1 hypothetical protein [Micromonospora sp. A200]
MSPRDAAAVNHIATDIRDMSDADLHRLAGKNACLPGENAAAVRHAIDAELEFRRAYRHAHLEATR